MNPKAFLSRFFCFNLLTYIAPDGSPGGLTGRNDSSTSVNVSWNELPKVDQNGIITAYILYYHVRGSATAKATLQTPSLNAHITGLSIYTEYAISVSASTQAGEGPDSDEIFVRTGEAGR